MLVTMDAGRDDPYLVDLVDYVNRSGAHVPLRVSVAGALLSAHLIPAAEWMRMQSADPARHEGAEWLAYRLAQMAQDLPGSATPFDDGDEAELPRYCHLAEMAAGQPTGASWRVRLAAVDGWSLGLA